MDRTGDAYIKISSFFIPPSAPIEKGNSRKNLSVFYSCIFFLFLQLLLFVDSSTEPLLISLLEKTEINMKKNILEMNQENPACKVQEENNSDELTATNLWNSIPNRPAFGGQLFSQMINCALSKNSGWKVSSANAIFLSPTITGKQIVYTIENTTQLGKTILMMDILATQQQDTVLRETVKCKIILTKETSDYKEIIRKRTENFLEEYGLQAYMKSAESSEALPNTFLSLQDYTKYRKFENNKYREDLYYTDKSQTVKVMDHPSDKSKRCVYFYFKDTPHSLVEINNKTTTLLLSFLSDQYLLETAILIKDEDIVSLKYNILTTTHSINFFNLNEFNILKPFFFSIHVKSIEDNNALCTGELIQNGIVFATVYQNGVIRERKAPSA
ncbi:hypothetical protein NEFER03_1693 [Nematocida sp. LUAm3]|nr:hypothetical protein NEFER03_1693 [Nematocida sp. LUAm3]KAI5175683.1 hypothetical protein NEFER02_1570 [Nematocida sp. LUAm2]KAI5178589.1 hypothetical protein NEFER01_1725 [Nematocida sp. LUAm1]